MNEKVVQAKYESEIVTMGHHLENISIRDRGVLKYILKKQGMMENICSRGIA
jgi:hypothetical protein